MSKIYDSDIVYYVNEEKRTVVAIATGMSRDAVDEIDDTIFSVSGKYSIRILFPKLILPDIMKAKAKCSPNDEWDEEIGKRVARTKLINHYNKVKARAIKEYADTLKMFTDKMYRLSNEYYERSDKPIEF